MVVCVNKCDLAAGEPLAEVYRAAGFPTVCTSAVGYWASKEDVIKNWAIDQTFKPQISEEERAEKVTGWNKAVKYSYGWAKED